MKVLAALSLSQLLAALPILQPRLRQTSAFQAPSLQRKVIKFVSLPSRALSVVERFGSVASISTRSVTATTNTALSSSTVGDEDPYSSPQLDTDALSKYVISAVTELSLFGATFQLLDLALARLDVQLPFLAIAFVFYAASLKSRVFNPLNNQRPDLAKASQGEGSSSGFRDRVMPSWTPPGVLFPIMWILIIGPLRAYSAALVVSHTGSFYSIPITAFILHLTIGDIWNTINNTEKRYGAAVVGVLCVVLSAAIASYQYSTVDLTAGKLLGGTCLWLTTAAALITDTWRLNPAKNGELVPLYPVKGEADTSFLWLNTGE